MKKLLGTATVLAAILATSSVSAATLFYDSFNRANSNNPGNGWTQLEDDNNDVGVFGNALRLRDFLPGNPDAAAASKTIDATGYTNIQVEFRWKGFSNVETGDDFYLSWAESPAPAMSNEGAWNEVFNGNTGGGTWLTNLISISPGADNSIFNLMFWSDVSSSSEGYKVDWVRVTGDAITPVPLPAALPLLAGGIGLLGFAGWRRRKTG